MDNSKPIDRKRFTLEPSHAAIVAGIEETLKKHLPEAEIVYGEAIFGHDLYANVITRKGQHSILHFYFGVPSDGWHKLS